MRLLASISIGVFAGAVSSAAQPDVETVYTKEAGEQVKHAPTPTAALELRNANGAYYTTLPAPTFQVTLCPEPTGFFAALNIESDLTFGCKPGFVCNPPKPEGCNFWPGPPPAEFRCQPEECMPTPPLHNVKWQDGKTGYYPPQHGYFNLNPEEFGLSYDIFEYNVVRKVEGGRTSTFTTGNWNSQTSLTDGPLHTGAPEYRRRSQQPYKQQGRRKTHKHVKRAPLPAICFDSCNTAFNIAQKAGKSPELCEEGSDFQNAFNNCIDCVSTAENITKAEVQAALDPPYSQFLFFCDGSGTTPTSSTSSAPDSDVSSTPTLGTSSQVSAGPTSLIDTTTSSPVKSTTTKQSTTQPPPPPTSSTSSSSTTSSSSSTPSSTPPTSSSTSSSTSPPPPPTSSTSSSQPPSSSAPSSSAPPPPSGTSGGSSSSTSPPGSSSGTQSSTGISDSGTTSTSAGGNTGSTSGSGGATGTGSSAPPSNTGGTGTAPPSSGTNSPTGTGSQTGPGSPSGTGTGSSTGTATGTGTGTGGVTGTGTTTGTNPSTGFTSPTSGFSSPGQLDRDTTTTGGAGPTGPNEGGNPGGAGPTGSPTRGGGNGGASGTGTGPFPSSTSGIPLSNDLSRASENFGLLIAAIMGLLII